MAAKSATEVRMIFVFSANLDNFTFETKIVLNQNLGSYLMKCQSDSRRFKNVFQILSVPF